MDASKDKAELVLGGIVNSKHNYISPTIYKNVSPVRISCNTLFVELFIEILMENVFIDYLMSNFVLNFY